MISHKITNGILVNFEKFIVLNYDFLYAAIEIIQFHVLFKANDHVQFYIKSNAEAFQICYMVSLYHTLQFVAVLHVDIFYKFLHFFVFYQKCGMEIIRFLIKSYVLSSSHQHFFIFAT